MFEKLLDKDIKGTSLLEAIILRVVSEGLDKILVNKNQDTLLDLIKYELDKRYETQKESY